MTIVGVTKVMGFLMPMTVYRTLQSVCLSPSAFHGAHDECILIVRKMASFDRQLTAVNRVSWPSGPNRIVTDLCFTVAPLIASFGIS